jgi:prolyl-tRNA synthetase
MDKKIPSKADKFSEWYPHVIIESGFVDYSSVSGCLVLRPDSYFAWDVVRAEVDRRFREIGILDTYFPLLIPERLLEKEQTHLAGFTPEVAWVTHAGDSKLEERLAIRPTSETIMYDSYSKWIKSWRDLPMKLNQWNNVLRWEFKHPTPFIRGREFLWNEGHTAFATQEEADAERDQILKIYMDALKEYLAIPGIIGKKTESEKFAGAVASYSIEHLMPDGKALQGPDFHSDGQNFAKAFGISFIDRDEQRKFVWQNTFGFSTRVLGVMVALHGDDKGLVIPPKVARIQVVIVPIYNDSNKWDVMNFTKGVVNGLPKQIRTHLDDRDSYSPGWKFNEWELRGVPIRVEIGKREMEAGTVVIATRHNGKKVPVKTAELNHTLTKLINEIHEEMYNTALNSLEARIHRVKTYEEVVKVVDSGGIAQAGWCGAAECELKMKEGAGAKITNMPFDAQELAKGCVCVSCSKKAKHIANFAKSY